METNIKNGIIAIALIASVLFHVSYAETSGNINLSFIQNNSSIVTGLRGITMVTTTLSTTTTVSNASSSNGDIETGNTTTTRPATTTTRSTTNISSNITTTTTKYTQYNAGNDWKNYSDIKLNSTINGTPNLSTALSHFFGMSDIDDNATADINRNITITKTLFVYKEGNSTIEMDIFYNGDVDRKNLMIYDILPKNFANSTDFINVSVIMLPSGSQKSININYSVVNHDPSYLFRVENIKKGDGIYIKYNVAGKVPSSVINSTSTIVFAGPQEDDFMWLVAVVVAISALAVLLAIFKNNIQSLFAKGSKYHHFHERAKSFDFGEFLKKIKERLTRKKKLVPHFFYKDGSKK